MINHKPVPVKTISAFHQLNGLPKPEHPLISVVDYSKMHRHPEERETTLLLGYYSIAIKRGVNKMIYGQQEYDFDEGVLYFMAPNQILRVSNAPNDTQQRSGWMLLIHPDFLWNTSLAHTIKQYDFFDYSVNEALFLSEKEEKTLFQIIENIRQEYHTNMDRFSKQIIITHIENLLSYAERFYNRQFITREKANHQILSRLETLLSDYFNSEDLTTKDLPTVQYISSELNISAKYLSTLLKTLTGKTTQQHVHEKLIEKAKEKLSATDLSVSEIAYELGFEHIQSFSKLFKNKTGVTPLEFRQSFN